MLKPHLMGVRTPEVPVLCEQCGSACVCIVAGWADGDVPFMMTARFACATCGVYVDE